MYSVDKEKEKKEDQTKGFLYFLCDVIGFLIT